MPLSSFRVACCCSILSPMLRLLHANAQSQAATCLPAHPHQSRTCHHVSLTFWTFHLSRPISSDPTGGYEGRPIVLDTTAIVDKIKANAMPKRMRTPNCTHVDMDRIYGRDQQCYVCGRTPPIGFLYECRQDHSSPSLHDLLSSQTAELVDPPKSRLRLELEEIGLSQSVIRAAEQGHYTRAQLGVLKDTEAGLEADHRRFYPREPDRTMSSPDWQHLRRRLLTTMAP